MITALSLIALGFFLGMRHATDPDHVIAVSTIVTRQRTLGGGVLIGGLWGLGHTLTIIVVGGAIIVFSVVIPPTLGLTMEMSVALMLVVLGLWNLTGIVQTLRDQLGGGTGLHAHVHRHGDYAHSHRHGHGPQDHGHREDATPQAWLDRHLGGLGPYQLLRPLVVGLVHGLAGSAAVALLVLTTISHPGWAMAYLVLFGIGTIVGMMLITLIIAAPMAYASRRLTYVERHLRVASGLLSLGFGLFLVYHIGFVNGLFTGHAVWTPK
ncbi:MAG TPA: high-affinity nickel-transport family protein [Patescibacteria group bacterium]|nr:high-affinity nickel-transport family protein [Patescibacteria group bacterium]